MVDEEEEEEEENGEFSEREEREGGEEEEEEEEEEKKGEAVMKGEGVAALLAKVPIRAAHKLRMITAMMNAISNATTTLHTIRSTSTLRDFAVAGGAGWGVRAALMMWWWW
jgi:hypothetical protein